MEDKTSLNKYISSSGFCSRRDADKLIEQARVTVNGELVLPGAKVGQGDTVEVDGEPIKVKSKARPIYIAFNKPVGVTSTTDPKDRSNIIYFINHPKRIFPVGRLDKDSDGLIFLTNDGDIVNKILRASNHHEKEYVVSVDRAVTPEFVKQMSSGVPVLGKITKPCFVRQEGSRRFRIILTQGLNRQIRRMCEHLGYEVKSLTRVRIMNVELGNLAVGKWRYLTLSEIEKLNELVAESSNTDNGHQEKGEIRAKVQYIPKKKKEFVPGDGMGERDKKVVGEKGKRETGEKGKRTTGETGARAPREKSKKGTYKDFRSKKGKGSK
jgi:23S rRNA pseudouridine2604 synthase